MPPESDPSGGYRGFSWRDRLLTPSIALALAAVSGCAAWQLRNGRHWGLLASAGVFYLVFAALTLGILALLRALFPIVPGTYSCEDAPWMFFHWRLQMIFAATFFKPYVNALLPDMLKRY